MARCGHTGGASGGADGVFLQKCRATVPNISQTSLSEDEDRTSTKQRLTSALDLSCFVTLFQLSGSTDWTTSFLVLFTCVQYRSHHPIWTSQLLHVSWFKWQLNKNRNLLSSSVNEFSVIINTGWQNFRDTSRSRAIFLTDLQPLWFLVEQVAHSSQNQLAILRDDSHSVTQVCQWKSDEASCKLSRPKFDPQKHSRNKWLYMT